MPNDRVETGRGEVRGCGSGAATSGRAGRRTLVRQLLTESLVLGVAGGIAGLVLGQIGLRALIALDPASVPRLNEVTLDPPVLLYATVVSVGTGCCSASPPWCAVDGSTCRAS